MTFWHPTSPAELTQEQSAFLADFMGRLPRRACLVAAPGTGKTTVATLAAKGCILAGHVDRILVIVDHQVSRDIWSRAFEEYLGHQVGPSNSCMALTSDEFEVQYNDGEIEHLNSHSPALVIVEELHRSKLQLYKKLERLLAGNPQNRALLLERPSYRRSQSSSLIYDTEYFFDTPVFRDAGIRESILRHAPTYGVLDSLLLQRATLDNLHWRQFEMLVQELLEAEGYEVQLMQGTKDGGVDVVAFVDQGPLGRFKTLWQAKKTGPGGKVGLATVRELADTRAEFGASKAFIITSAYLTKGALQRIQRDQFLLGKVDRGELDDWISRVLQSRHGSASGLN